VTVHRWRSLDVTPGTDRFLKLQIRWNLVNVQAYLRSDTVERPGCVEGIKDKVCDM